MTKSSARTLGLTGLAMFLTAGWARADLLFTMEELGPDVVVSASGVIDTSKLTPIGQWFAGVQATITPNDGQIILGVGFDLGDRYSLTTGADVFGSGNTAVASSSTGDAIDLHGMEEFLGLPAGYVSGTQITTTMTFDGQTFASLGVTPGTYDRILEDGQTVTLPIGAGAGVPEPSALALLAIGGLGLAMRLRRPAGE